MKLLLQSAQAAKAQIQASCLSQLHGQGEVEAFQKRLPNTVPGVRGPSRQVDWPKNLHLLVSYRVWMAIFKPDTGKSSYCCSPHVQDLSGLPSLNSVSQVEGTTILSKGGFLVFFDRSPMSVHPTLQLKKHKDDTPKDRPRGVSSCPPVPVFRLLRASTQDYPLDLLHVYANFSEVGPSFRDSSVSCPAPWKQTVLWSKRLSAVYLFLAKLVVGT